MRSPGTSACGTSKTPRPGLGPIRRIGQASGILTPVATVYINEVRRFSLPTPAVLEIVLQFDRESAGKVWRRPILDATVTLDPEPGLRVTMHSRGSEPPEPYTFEATIIAASLIRFFEKARIPLSRSSKKSIEVVDNELVMTLETRVPVVLTPSATASSQNE